MKTGKKSSPALFHRMYRNDTKEKYIVQNRWHVRTSLFLLCIYLEWHRNNWTLKSRTRTSLSSIHFSQNFTLNIKIYKKENRVFFRPSPLPNAKGSLRVSVLSQIWKFLHWATPSMQRLRLHSRTSQTVLKLFDHGYFSLLDSCYQASSGWTLLLYIVGLFHFSYKIIFKHL